MDSVVANKALNNQQKQVVNHGDGPLLVVAGAGTGKTKVVVDRMARLIADGANPSSILALTFTEKAASEMLDRLSQIRGSYSLDTTVMTYNAFGGEVLKTYAVEIGLSPNPRLLHETGQLVFLRQHIDALGLDYFAPISAIDSQLDSLAKYFSKLKQQLVTPETYSDFVKKLPTETAEQKLELLKHQELAGAFNQYITLAKQQAVIDYDDQIYLTIELLKQRPNIREKLQQQYQYILVDEYQDTNPMQAVLLDLITNKKQNLMVVGDDDQSVYGWRGATLANILDFKQRYPKTKEITLIDNYRSTQAILDAGYQLIQHNNPDRLEARYNLNKKLVSHRGKGSSPKVISFSSLDSELMWIAEDILKQLEAGRHPGSIAVLARRNNIIQKIHQVLEVKGIDHAVTGISSDMYKQPAVANLIEVLRAIADPNDQLALYHTLGGPLFKISPSLLAEVLSIASGQHLNLNQKLVETNDKTVQQALEQIDKWRESSHDTSVGQLAYEVISDSGWRDELYRRAEDEIEVAIEVQALSQFFNTLKDFEGISRLPSLASYMASYEVLATAGSQFDDSQQLTDDKVNLLTVHRAKGLEWDRVYIADLTEGSMPLRKFGDPLPLPQELAVTSQADQHIAEERRLMYVATTRAKQELLLTYSLTHTGSTKRSPSRFLHEMLGSTYNSIDKSKQSDQPAGLELFETATFKTELALPARFYSGDKMILSVTQVGNYLRCPLDFYWRYVLCAPQPPSTAGPYGNLIHKAIELILKSRQQGAPISFDDILSSLDNMWPISGYHSARHRDRSVEQGKRTLKKIYQRFMSEELPKFIEMQFKVLVPNSQLLLKGRLDAVYQRNDGVEIRDFKTGSSAPTAETAKSRATSSEQLALYALAWRVMHNQMPELLSLDYVETEQIGSVRKQAKTIDKLEQKLAEIPASIQAGKFPLGPDHRFCRHPSDDLTAIV